MLLDALLVGLGGFLGSVARYLVYFLLQHKPGTRFPTATLLVNVVGCFAVGWLAAYLERHHPSSARITLFVSMGILGGFTTFSAFGLETATLLRLQQYGTAALSIAAHLLLGIAAVAAGRYLASGGA